MREIKIERRITPGDERSVGLFLKEVSRIPLLITEEEERLATLSVQGDRTAQGQIVESNLRFVVSIAKQYQNQGLELSDLIQEGSIGMMKASRKFDPTRGFKFVSYAVWWIRQSILAALSEHSMVWLPSNLISDISKVRKAVEVFQSRMDREPSIEELSGLVKMKEPSVIKAFRGMKVLRHTSLDAPVSGLEEGDPLPLYSMVPEESSGPTDSLASAESIGVDLDRVLAFLPELQRKVLRMHFGIGCDPMDFYSIGQAVGMTDVHVRVVCHKAVERLRSSKEAKEILRKYLS